VSAVPAGSGDARVIPRRADLGAGPVRLGAVIPEVLDRGARHTRPVKDVLEDFEDSAAREYRVRTPTNSERLNRALTELSLSAFKVHTLIWKWRGAPARGSLPFFTIRSLERFCHLTRPTIRVALTELTKKGWIKRSTYNKHYKNTLFSLVPIRRVPAPAGSGV